MSLTRPCPAEGVNIALPASLVLSMPYLCKLRDVAEFEATKKTLTPVDPLQRPQNAAFHVCGRISEDGSNQASDLHASSMPDLVGFLTGVHLDQHSLTISRVHYIPTLLC